MDAGRRLDKFLEKTMPGAGLSFICKMLRKKNITVNGKKTEGSYKLAEGDEIRMFFSEETYAKMSDPNRQDGTEKNDPAGIKEYRSAYEKFDDIKIVYEDEDFIFIDKPAGILSQKSEKGTLSVNEWLAGYMLNTWKITEDELRTFRPAFANRLDRNTSGLMLGGKSLKALQSLSELLRSRDLDKYYLCLASGSPDEKLPVTEETYTDIYGYLVKDASVNTVKVYTDRPEDIDKADKVNKIHTAFKLLDTVTGSHYADPYMLLEVKLYTGKSHQIRAQLAALDHPIAGDPKYGRKYTGPGKDHQLLHAYRVVFPELKEWPNISLREFKTGIPDCFLR